MRLLLLDNNALFESLTSKLLDYPELEQILKGLLFSGKAISYTPTNQVINLALMFGFVKNEGGNVIPANRIFDTLLYNHFLSLDEMGKADIYKASLQDKNQFIRDGRLDMRRILEKFVLHFHVLSLLFLILFSSSDTKADTMIFWARSWYPAPLRQPDIPRSARRYPSSITRICRFSST